MLCRSLFRKALPTKPVASADAHTAMVTAQLHGTTCSKCGHLNHWAQQCRSSWRRNSSTGHSPSPGRPQNRQRRFSSNKPHKGRGCRGGGGKQKSTPKRPGGGCGRGGGKPFKMNTLTVTGLPDHNTLLKLMVWEETKQRSL